MSSWAYACRPCGPGLHETIWYVPRETVDELPPSVSRLMVKTGDDWREAIVDRSRAVAVEGLLLRQAVAATEAGIDDAAAAPARRGETGSAEAHRQVPASTDEPTRAQAIEPSPLNAPRGPEVGEAPGRGLQAAAIALAGRRMLVVLVPLNLVQSPGEAAMLAADLRTRFGGVEVVLMGQDDDGTPHWHGPAELVTLLHGVPLERMPWQTYPMR